MIPITTKPRPKKANILDQQPASITSQYSQTDNLHQDSLDTAIDFLFKTKKLEALYTEGKNANKYPKEVVDAFFEVMTIIAAAETEQDLRNVKGLRLENLIGDRKGQKSVRLNQRWRLIISIEKDELGKYISIIEITKHYQ